MFTEMIKNIFIPSIIAIIVAGMKLSLDEYDKVKAIVVYFNLMKMKCIPKPL